MKSLVILLVFYAAFALSAPAAVDTQNFPCNWSDRLKIPKLDDQIYQCLGVAGKTLLRYSFVPDDPTDSFQVLILNSTQFDNYRTNRYFVCINEPQCRYGDTTVKQGSYTLMGNGMPYYVIIKNNNFIERAFVSASLSVVPIGNAPYAPPFGSQPYWGGAPGWPRNN